MSAMMRYRLTPIMKATIKKQKITSVGQDVKKWLVLCTTAGKVKYCIAAIEPNRADP